MIIDCVLTACNSNNIYSSLIPMFIQAWNILFPEIDVKIIYIDDNIPDNLKNYEKSLGFIIEKFIIEKKYSVNGPRKLVYSLRQDFIQ